MIGAGQAGLAMGWHLARLGLRFQIVDAGSEVGQTWRRRWDSLKLFTAAQYDGLPGMAFPAPHDTYPGKDDVADFLQRYAAKLELPVVLNARVTCLQRMTLYEIDTEQGPIRAHNVVIATGPFQTPFVPPLARELDAGVVQLHGIEYRRPGGIPRGRVLAVGARGAGRPRVSEPSRARRPLEPRPRRCRGDSRGRRQAGLSALNGSRQRHRSFCATDYLFAFSCKGRGLADRPRADGRGNRRPGLSARDGRPRPDVLRPAQSPRPRPRPRHPRRLDRRRRLDVHPLRRCFGRLRFTPGAPTAKYLPRDGLDDEKVETLVRARCRGVMRVVAIITEPHVIRRIFDHLAASARRVTQGRALPGREGARRSLRLPSGRLDRPLRAPAAALRRRVAQRPNISRSGPPGTGARGLKQGCIG